MPRYFLKKIQIEGFRGINNEGQPLEIKLKEDAVNSVFGGNASGKSSVYEALCYALKGSIPKLDNLPASEKADAYYNNIFHSSRNGTIVLTLYPDDQSDDIVIQVQLLSSGNRTVTSPSNHPNPESLLEALNNELVLLDYSTFHSFIEDSPLSRGRSFAGLVGLSQLSNFRQALATLSNIRNIETDFELTSRQDAIRNLKTEADANLTMITSCFEKLTGEELERNLANDKVVAKVTDVLKEDGVITSFFVDKDILSIDFNIVFTAIKEAEKSEDQVRLSELNQNIQQLKTYGPSNEESDQQNNLRDAILKYCNALKKTKGSLLRRLYNNGLAVLESEDWGNNKTCPLCETKDLDNLNNEIQLKLKSYSDVETCKATVNTCLVNATWLGRISSLENILEIEQQVRKSSDLQKNLSSDIVTAANLDTAIMELGRLEKTRRTKLAGLLKEQRKLQKLLPKSLVELTQKIDWAKQLAEALVNDDKIYSCAEKKEKELLKINRWKAFIELASLVFSTAEVKMSNELVTSFEKRYRDYYQKITRNDDIVPVLEKSSGSEELHLKLEGFYGRSGLSANPLLSESYKNALAISIFLAAAVQRVGAARFIVLDDITSSFDSPHQLFLMDLLRNDVAVPNTANGPQVILLSHDGMLEKYYDKLSQDVSWNHQKLKGIAPNGNVFIDQQGYDRIRQKALSYINLGNVDAAKPYIRPYLEYKLLQVIKKVRIPVPIEIALHSDKRMVYNCIEAIKNAVSIYCGAGQLILTQAQQNAVNNTLIPSIIANWTSHYDSNTGLNVPQHIAIAILNDIDKLVDSFMYDCTCDGRQRRFYKNLSQKHCEC